MSTRLWLTAFDFEEGHSLFGSKDAKIENRTLDLITIAQQKLQENRVNNCLITVEKPDYYTQNVLLASLTSRR